MEDERFVLILDDRKQLKALQRRMPALAARVRVSWAEACELIEQCCLPGKPTAPPAA